MTPEYSIEIMATGQDSYVVALVVAGVEIKASCKDRKTAQTVTKAFVDIVFTEDKDEIEEKMRTWDGVFPGVDKDDKKGRDN
jgi:hypothetical protein